MGPQGLVAEHPDTGASIAGVAIPHWETMLTMAAQGCELTLLGCLGVDIVLDKEKGPLLIEFNVRPGLAIQIANTAGLLHRARLVEKSYQDLTALGGADRLCQVGVW